MSRCHVRCRKCDARRVLPRAPAEYVREPTCACGGAWRPDKWMNTRDTSLKGMGCNCSGYHFTHRRGSRFCWNRADGTVRVPGDKDFADRDLGDEEIKQLAELARLEAENNF